jgi:hypothetical protein
LSEAIISSSSVAKRPNWWRFCPVQWATLFPSVLLVLPPGGDGSKIARFGEWQNGEGAYFHSLTGALTHTAVCVGFAGGLWRRLALSALFHAFYLY